VHKDSNKANIKLKKKNPILLIVLTSSKSFPMEWTEDSFSLACQDERAVEYFSS
jgi:hypothetical protein